MAVTPGFNECFASCPAHGVEIAKAARAAPVNGNGARLRLTPNDSDRCDVRPASGMLGHALGRWHRGGGLMVAAAPHSAQAPAG